MARVVARLRTLGEVAVPTAGTAVPLSATQLFVKQAIVQFVAGNVGNIFIGESGVTSSNGIVLNASGPVFTLSAEDSLADEDDCVFDLSQVFINAANNGDKVRVAYIDIASVQYGR